MSTYILSTNSDAVVAGDVVCIDPTNGNPTKATPAAMAVSRAVLGIATIGASPGTNVLVADFGIVVAAVSGLGPGTSTTVTVSTTARCQRTEMPFGGEYGVGICDIAGNVILQPRSELGTGSSHFINVRAYGAVGDGRTDDLPAFNRAIAAMAALGMPGATGGKLVIPPGVYYLSDSLVISRTCVIQGSGSYMERPATILHFPFGVDGIVLGYTVEEGRADSTQIRDLKLEAEGSAPPIPASRGHGVRAKCRFFLENVWIHGFSGNGIHVQSSGTIADQWYIASCRVSSCGVLEDADDETLGNGLYLDGADSNAGTAVMLDCADNSKWGIYDSSFLGNTFVGCVTHNNGRGPYKTDWPTQRSVFIGCYSESGQLPSQIARGSMVVGGQHAAGVIGTGFRLYGEGHVTPFSVTVETGSGTAGLEVGTDSPGHDAYLGFRSPGAHSAYTMLRHLRQSSTTPDAPFRGDWIGMDSGHLNIWGLLMPLDPASSLHVAGSGATMVTKQPGYIPTMRLGMRWGMKAKLFAPHARYDGGPPADGQIYEVGDILFNLYATEPGYPWSGWIGAMCAMGGTAGTYSEGLTITATGTNVVTLSAPSTVLKNGDYLLIGGTTQARVVGIDGITVTLSVDIPSGSGLSLAYTNPIWKKFGALEP